MLLITFRGNNVNEIPIGPYESNVMNINHGQSVEWLHTDQTKTNRRRKRATTNEIYLQFTIL